MAPSFLVFLVPRCETESDVFLELESIALAPMSHVDDTGTQFDTWDFRNCQQLDELAGHARKSAGFDTVELAGDILHVRFRGNTNATSFYGIVLAVIEVGILKEKQMEEVSTLV